MFVGSIVLTSWTLGNTTDVRWRMDWASRRYKITIDLCWRIGLIERRFGSTADAYLVDRLDRVEI
jgi:hypothetical protein